MLMERLKIRNFGPVLSGFSESPDGYFDINNVSIFIGNQGTGKSTVAKIYSTFAWLEKVLVQNRYEKADFAFEEFQDLCENQRIPKSYFTDETELGYKGSAYEFCVNGTKFNIHPNLKNSNYICPKIMYVPSERNLLSVLEHPDQIKQLPQMVKDFSIELKNAHLWLKKHSNLSFLGYDIKYNENEDVDYIKPKDFDENEKDGDSFVFKGFFKSIPITKASSGLQSAIPLISVTDYLANKIEKDILKRIRDLDASRQNFVVKNINNASLVEKVKLYLTSNIDKNFSENEKSELAQSLSKYVNSCFINIVEEPEQNLFPESQIEILETLLIHKRRKGDKLVVTTHSPYILSALNNYIYAKEIYSTSKKAIKEIPQNLFVDINEVSAYKLEDGKIHNIIDNECKLIDASAIDSCSSKINKIYSDLMELDVNE